MHGILLEGWLHKKGHINHAYRRRFFRLDTDGVLRYFESKMATKEKGAVLLKDIATVDEDAACNQSGEYVFRLHPILKNQRVYCLRADSPVDKSTWIAALSAQVCVCVVRVFTSFHLSFFCLHS